MSWLKIDDQLPRHPKIVKVGHDAAWLWLSTIAYSQSQLTDGFITPEALAIIGFDPVSLLEISSFIRKNAKDRDHILKLSNDLWLESRINRLVAARLFDKVDGGYRVHDYLEYNASRSDVLKKRKEEVARKQRNKKTSENTPTFGRKPR